MRAGRRRHLQRPPICSCRFSKTPGPGPFDGHLTQVRSLLKLPRLALKLCASHEVVTDSQILPGDIHGGRCAAEAVGGEGGDAGSDEAVGGDGLTVFGIEGELEEVVGDGGGGGVGVGLDGDGGEDAAAEAGTEGTGFFGDEAAEGGHPFVNGARGDRILAVKVPGGRAGACGELEEMQVGERLRGDEAVALVEEGCGFAGETDHDVGADDGVGEELTDLGEALGVMPGAIAAVHAAEDGVGTGLQGEMGVASEARMVAGGEFAVEGEEVR